MRISIPYNTICYLAELLSKERVATIYRFEQACTRHETNQETITKLLNDAALAKNACEILIRAKNRF